jgi:hypothetical protein
LLINDTIIIRFSLNKDKIKLTNVSKRGIYCK